MSETPEGRTLPPFPVDDFTLDQLEHALDTCLGDVIPDSDGRHERVGGEFTMSDFLQFMSGYDPDRSTFVGMVGDPMGFGEQVPMYEHWDQQYNEHSVITALIAEVRRLRGGEPS